MFKTIILWWGLNIKDIVYNQICKLTDKKNIEGTQFILAISGGLDSVALLNLILKIKKNVAIDLSLFHVNYNIG